EGGVVLARAVQDEGGLELDPRAHLRARDLQGARASQRAQRRLVFAQARRGQTQQGPGLSAALSGGGQPLEVVTRFGVSLEIEQDRGQGETALGPYRAESQRP